MCRTTSSGKLMGRQPAKYQSHKDRTFWQLCRKGGKNESSDNGNLLKYQVNNGHEGLKSILGKTEPKMTDKLTHHIILKFFQVTFEALHNLTTFSPVLKSFPLNTLELNPPLQPHKKSFLHARPAWLYKQVYFFTHVLPSARNK